MLTGLKADVVFLVDESSSQLSPDNQAWLAALVSGDVNGDGNNSGPPVDTMSLAEKLRDDGIDDVRYGLVGFGEFDQNDNPRYAQSQLFDFTTGDPDSLFGDPTAPQSGPHDPLVDTSDLNTIFDTNLRERGGIEDGWDALEHAIAEYRLREGAVPIFVLVQGEEGRIPLNDTLTRDGVLAALKSKNAILDVMVVGDNVINFNGTAANDWEPLFDLAPYEASAGDFANRRILGVEADAADGVVDGMHDYHLIEEGTGAVVTAKPATQSGALQISYNGSNTGATGMVASGKSILIGQSISGGIGGGSGDANSYRARSVPFAPEDMTGATVVDPSQPISIPFGFNYFGAAETQLWAISNGLITFDAANSNQLNEDWSQVTPASEQPSIAVLWDRIDASSIGEERTKYFDLTGADDDYFAIEWTQYRYADDFSGDLDPITFQAVLSANGRIRINYLDLESFPANDFDATLNDTGGISATVGIWGGQDDTISLPAGKYVPGLHDIDGTVFEFTQSGGDVPVETVDTNDSYVWLAWDTGGAAWDIGVVDAYSENGGINSSEANALRDGFIDSLASQIFRAAAAGEVYHIDQVLLALNVGSSSSFDAGPAGIFRADDGSYTAPVDGGADTGAAAVDSFTNTVQTVDVTSTNSIPVGTESMLQSVFASARGEATDDFVDENVSFTIDKLDVSGTPTAMSDGTYIVELFFAELDAATSFPGSRVFDVRLEGKTMLNDYDVFADHAKINESYSSIETDSEQAGAFTGSVKRFEVEVTGGDGLQIDLIREAGDPILNGLRLLRADAPRVENVVLKGTNWADGVDYSYADVIPDGGQLRPVYLDGADTIEIQFTGPVNLSNGNLVILSDNRLPLSSVPLTANYNVVSHVASWSLSAPLAAGKYAIQLTGVTGAASSLLDGDWDNLFGGLPSAPTIDDFADDLVGRRLLSGDGTPGGAFQFFFSVLPGDSNQNGVVEADPNGVHADLDAGVLRDVDGDGVSGTAADEAIAISVDGEVLPFGPSRGDIVDYDNDMVDVLDWIAWKSFQGTGDPRGDLDGDGDQDLSDFWIFRSNFESFSAWYTGPLIGVGSGSALSLVVTAGAPKVGNVTISGSTSTHNPYSFASATYNVQPVIGSGNQLRTVPVGGADTISVTFNEDVNILANDLTLVGLQTANRPVLAEFTYDIGTLTATWRFENLGEADQYLISLADAVTDVEGNPLDGEWVNPVSIFTTNSVVSEFPSGDGTAGGDFDFVFTILPGDANLDSWVQSSDQGDYWSNYYSSGEDRLFADCDWDGDGIVDWPDEDLFYLNLGTNLQSISLLGDLNGDWVVDESDGNIVDANFGMSNPTLADGDLNADGAIDAHDLDLMFAYYGLQLNVVS